MELRHLRYFIAVAEEQNISRAALRLHISQPPLSRQIRDLEHELGVRLFDRTAHAVRLTAAGWAFLEECYGALRQIDRAVRAARAAEGTKGKQLQLGYAPGPTQAFLRDVLRRLRAEDPQLRVVLHDLSTQEIIHGVQSGELNAGLVVEPESSLLRDLVFETVRLDDQMVAVMKDHPWAKRKAINRTQLPDAAWVMLSKRDYPEHREKIARMLGVPVTRLNVVEECDSGTSLIASIESGAGIAVISNSLASVVGDRLRLIPIRPKPPPSAVGVLSSSSRRDPLTERLRLAARKAARAEAG